MKTSLLLILVLGSFFHNGKTSESLDEILFQFKSLEFEKANSSIEKLEEGELKENLGRLNELLYYAGQKDSINFRLIYSP